MEKTREDDRGDVLMYRDSVISFHLLVKISIKPQVWTTSEYLGPLAARSPVSVRGDFIITVGFLRDIGLYEGIIHTQTHQPFPTNKYKQVIRID